MTSNSQSSPSYPLVASHPPVWAGSATTRAALPGDRDADVVIIGGGYTGLWTAYYLITADPTLRVTILEAEHIGFGASGRNGGWCSAIFPISLDRVTHYSNRQSAIDLQMAMNDTVHEIGTVVRRESIDCDFAQEGFVSLARTPAQLARVDGARAAAARYGFHDQWTTLGADEARKIVNATGVLGGTFTEHCAVVHPSKLVRGLATVVEGLGVTIYEGTRVQTISAGQVDTNRGRVCAAHIVRATEAFTPDLPGQRRTLAPLYSLVLATEPLSTDVRDSLNLNHRVAFNDMRNLRIYAQATAEGRLVFGGRGAPYHFGSKVSARFDTNEKIHHKIHRTMLDFFPTISSTQLTHRWGGPLGVPRDWHPSVGLDRDTGLAWAGPNVGDGVATSTLAGRVLRNLILERDEPLNQLPIVNHRSRKWEPEPLRWLGVNVGLQAAAFGDLEEQVTKKPSKVWHLLEALTGAH